MGRKGKIIAIFIAYNAAKTLVNFYKEFPKHLVDEIILVDDASKDDTFKLAKNLGIISYQNPINLGYGGNMKKTLAIALSRGGDILIDIHPDGEYNPSAIPIALREIDQGAKLVLGNRFTSINKLLKSGMYPWKLIPITILNWIGKKILRVKVDDLHQGFRVYTKNLLKQISFEENSNNYLFSFELIAQAIYNNIKIAQVPVETNYSGKKRGASLKHSIKYSLGTFIILLLFILAKLGLKNKLFREPSQDLETRISKLIQSI